MGKVAKIPVGWIYAELLFFFFVFFFAEPKANAFIHIRAQYGALWQSKLK